MKPDENGIYKTGGSSLIGTPDSLDPGMPYCQMHYDFEFRASTPEHVEQMRRAAIRAVESHMDSIARELANASLVRAVMECEDVEDRTT